MANRIHPTALIDSSAELGEDVEIGAYTIIDPGVRIGDRCQIHGHVQLLNATRLGPDCKVGGGSILGGDPQDLSFDSNTRSRVEIGRANVIREHVTIHRSASEDGVTRMGQENYLMATSHLAHDVLMGDHNVVANQCMFGGHVHIGNRNFFGGGGGYHQFIRIGNYCMIKGNASISTDVPPFVLASHTNAARGLNVIGLRRAGFDATTRKDIKAAFDLIYRGGMNLTQALVAAEEQEWTPAATEFLDFFRQESKKGFCAYRKD